MVYDLTFDEAIDVLQSKIGWVQGENFNKDEYLSIDRSKNVFIKNVADNTYYGRVWDRCCKQTREIYTDIKFMPEEMKIQKYRFILVLNQDSINGIGVYSSGNNRDSYLIYKRMKNINRQ